MSSIPKRKLHITDYEVYNAETGEVVGDFRTRAAAEHVRWCRAGVDRQELIHTPWSIRHVNQATATIDQLVAKIRHPNYPDGDLRT